MNDFPGRLEAAWLDSPWFPETDDLTGGALGTRSALAELFAACAADDRCAARYPRLEQSWNRALAGTATRPLTGRGKSADGPVDVVVDDAKLLRFVRYSLGGEGTSNLSWLPRVITDAAAGRLHPHLADLVASDPPFCAGYRPQCLNMGGFALGVYLTSLCQEQLPGLDADALRDAVAGDAAYEQVFEHSPYAEACDAWATHRPVEPPSADPQGTRLLLIPGQFDSFSRPEWSEAEAEAHGRRLGVHRPEQHAQHPRLRRVRALDSQRLGRHPGRRARPGPVRHPARAELPMSAKTLRRAACPWDK